MWNMFKVNNEDTRTMPLASFWDLYCYFWTYFTSCSSIFIVNFEHVNAGWVIIRLFFQKKNKKKTLFISVVGLNRLCGIIIDRLLRSLFHCQYWWNFKWLFDSFQALMIEWIPRCFLLSDLVQISYFKFNRNISNYITYSLD